MAESESCDLTKCTSNQVSAIQYHPATPMKRMSKRMQEHTGVDTWLKEKGYYRKDTPKDPTCLFRAVSEQMYHTQYYHLRVRKECVAFMKKMRHLFEKSIYMSYEHYLEQMEFFTEWGGMNEIRAMSMLYKRDVIIFNGQKRTVENVTNSGSEQKLYLCYTPPKHYEIVLSLLCVKQAAYCQSLVYGTLYECVFNMTGITHTADKMLRDGNIRHDIFFQKENLEFREQFTVDLYNRVENNRINTDEVQFDSRGTSPISYKVAKALSPDVYRNTDFDTWLEMKREVKYGGWNRYNSNELQVGGKCLINLNSLTDHAKNNNNSSQPSTSECNTKNPQQKAKQEKLFYFGYIQKMGTNEEPALVFVEELGEMRLVPYTALKPVFPPKKTKYNFMPHTRKNTSTDAGRRWKKTYNSTSRKKKEHTNTSAVANNTSANSTDGNNNKGTEKLDTDCKADEHNNEFFKVEQEQTSENDDIKDCVNHATSKVANDPPTAVAHNNSQSLKTNNAVQEVAEDRKKANIAPIFTKYNNNFASKPTRSAGFNNYNYTNSHRNSYSKAKTIDENYCPPNVNSQINLVANPDLFYVFTDGITCPVFPFVPRNFGDFETDHFIPPKFVSNSGMEYLRVNETWNYGAMAFGPGHHDAPASEGLPNGGMNNAPYMREEVEHLVNGMQNCTLTCNETEGCNTGGKSVNSAEPIVYKAPFPYINGVQNSKHFKQGPPRNLSNKNFSYQVSDKKHSGIINKGGRGNKTRYQQNNRDARAYVPYLNHNSANVPVVPANDARIITHIQQQSQNLDPVVQQQHQQAVVNSMNACAPYVPPPSNIVFYPNDVTTVEACCNPYYMNGAFVPIACFPPGTTAYHDVPENAVPVPPPPYSPHPFPQHTEAYPSAPNYPSTMCPPMIYPPTPPQIQFSSIMQQQQQHQQSPAPPPPPPTVNMQEHWYPMITSSHYMQYVAPAAPVITEQPCNRQTTGTSA